MDINVRYFGRLAEIAGVDSELLSIENNVLSEALKKVTTRKPELEQELFAVFVNKKKAVNENTPLSENDELSLMPPFAGG